MKSAISEITFSRSAKTSPDDRVGGDSLFDPSPNRLMGPWSELVMKASIGELSRFPRDARRASEINREQHRKNIAFAIARYAASPAQVSYEGCDWLKKRK